MKGAVDSLKQAVSGCALNPPKFVPSLADGVSTSGELSSGDIEQYWRCWDLSDELSDKLSFVNRLEGAYYDFGAKR